VKSTSSDSDKAVSKPSTNGGDSLPAHWFVGVAPVLFPEFQELLQQLSQAQLARFAHPLGLVNCTSWVESAVW